MPTTFLELPPEVRVQVYSLCFDWEETKVPRYGHAQRGATILRTCRMVYLEARPILYEQTAVILNGTGIQPFPTTLDRHMTAEARRWLVNLTILDPKAMPYRYPPGTFPSKAKRTMVDWNFGILRHLPDVRNITLSDVSPIHIKLESHEDCTRCMTAVEHYICHKMTFTMAVFGERKRTIRPDVTISTVARITFSRPGYVHFAGGDSQHSCQWLLATQSRGCSGEIVARTQVHPKPSYANLDPALESSAVAMFRRQRIIHGLAGNPVRCV